MSEAIVRKDGITDPEEYQKDKDEFADTLDLLFEADGKSDEEINKLMGEKDGKDSDTAGEATRDQNQNADDQLNSGLAPAGTDGDNVDGQSSSSATNDGDSDVDWKQRALTAEAEMTKMQQKMKSWEGRIKAANKAKTDAEAKLAQIPSEEDISDAEKIAKFRKEFPELMDVVDIQQKKIDRLSKPADTQTDIDADLDNTDAGSTKVDDDTTNTVDAAPTDHYVATRKAHPDLDEIVSQGVLKTWINQQPVYIQPHLLKVYGSGTVEQVDAMVTEFKEKTGWKSQLAGKGESAKTAKLKAMEAVDSETSGPGDHLNEPDKNDFDGAAKDAFKEE